MSWNYRVIEKTVSSALEDIEGNPILDYEGESYSIHEVYYDKEGNITMWSENPITPYGEGTVKDLEVDLKMMLEALNKPVIKFEELQLKKEK